LLFKEVAHRTKVAPRKSLFGQVLQKLVKKVTLCFPVLSIALPWKLHKS
jgi:hypothetical protein